MKSITQNKRYLHGRSSRSGIVTLAIFRMYNRRLSVCKDKKGLPPPLVLFTANGGGRGDYTTERARISRLYVPKKEYAVIFRPLIMRFSQEN